MIENVRMFPAPKAGRQKFVVWLCISAGLLLIAAANAHLVYVAITSQPACAPHYRRGESFDGALSAASSACRFDVGAINRIRHGEGEP